MPFGVSRGSREAHLNRLPDAGVVAVRNRWRWSRRQRASRHDAVGEADRELMERAVVGQRQRLQRCVRAITARANGVRVRSIERRQHWIRTGSPIVRVHAAAITFWPGAFGPRLLLLRDDVDSFRLRRMHAWPAELSSQQTARGKANVANQFRLQPNARLPAEQLVARIALAQFGPRERRLPVRGRGDDQAVQTLEAPGWICDLRFGI